MGDRGDAHAWKWMAALAGAFELEEVIIYLFAQLDGEAEDGWHGRGL